ncbi:MAG: hypothetical protein KC729_20295, partial [Candidatus Eisenbacteria bacterium]|nr:hypothetical protein [Candidatus Eisenbacteria bacterium]
MSRDALTPRALTSHRRRAPWLVLGLVSTGALVTLGVVRADSRDEASSTAGIIKNEASRLEDAGDAHLHTSVGPGVVRGLSLGGKHALPDDLVMNRFQHHADVIFIGEVLAVEPAPPLVSGFAESYQRVSFRVHETTDVLRGTIPSSRITISYPVGWNQPLTQSTRPALREDLFPVGSFVLAGAVSAPDGLYAIDSATGVVELFAGPDQRDPETGTPLYRTRVEELR